ncbi:MAG: PadR family transcriptional regulator [Chloroflexota bacterium]
MSLQHLILGILNYAPVSGYDLNKAFRASVQHFWDTDQSQIYRALHKMHDLGWVAMEVVEQDSLPDKKIYGLTETGRAELRRWLAAPEPMPSLHEGWLGQLFFAQELDAGGVRPLLAARIAEIEQLLQRYENDAPASAADYATLYDAPKDALFWLMTLDYGIQKMRFERQWAESVLRAFPPENPRETE